MSVVKSVNVSKKDLLTKGGPIMKLNTLTFILIIFTALFIFNCGQKEEQAEKPVKAESPAETVEDTTVKAKQGAISQPETEEIKKSKDEIQTSLEGLLSLVEKKEIMLLSKEKELLKLDKDVQQRVKELNQREARVKSQQRFAWLLLIIAIIVFLIAFFITTRGRKKYTETKAVVKETRGNFSERMDQQIKALEEKLGDLSKKADHAKDDVKEGYQKSIEEIEKRLTEGKKKLQELQDANAEVWDGLKDGVEKAWKDVQDAYDRAAGKIK